MKNKIYFILYILLFTSITQAQDNDITTALYETYEQYKEPALAIRRIKHQDLQPLIKKLETDPKFTIKKVGHSIEGRSISLISMGSGDTDVFLWSQMHGDEPTATQAIFDIFNFLRSDDFAEEKREILANLKLHFLPMLNPDGAEVFMRRNRLGVDINRDALHLQSPESKILKKVRDSLSADFGFNLHDQSTYYNAERTEKPATISYLAPAYNYEKEINEVRGNAMKVIVFMNSIIQKYAPGQVGRYNDDFEPRAFGDNIQRWGTSAILIESGGYPNDPEKQEIRKLNYVSILSAIYTIAKGNYKDIPLSEYEKIPENDRKLFDLKITNLTYPLLENNYKLDLGIHRLEIGKTANSFYYTGSIADQGDLSTFYGYETMNATGYTAKAGSIYPKTLKSLDELYKMDVISLLKAGYLFIRVEGIPKETKDISVPMNVISPTFKIPRFRFYVGATPNFVLEKDGKIDYAVVNGFLVNLSQGKGDFKNALIFR